MVCRLFQLSERLTRFEGIETGTSQPFIEHGTFFEDRPDQSALKYLQSGLRKGLIRDRFVGQWPKNIWSVTDNGHPLEAQLENSMTGTYHGYPMPMSDPLASEIVRLWGN
jgi:hypothetical protein